MLNQVIIVGSLVNDPKLEILEDGRKVTRITLEVKRPYRNKENNEYESDLIQCTLWSGIAENTVEYCKSGSTIGVKARLNHQIHKCDDGKTFEYVEVVAEKITFINSKEKDLNLKN